MHQGKIMQKEVLALLSSFLEAIPAQVKIWDKKVIDYLSGNTRALQEFKAGSNSTKWDIYSETRYQHLH